MKIILGVIIFCSYLGAGLLLVAEAADEKSTQPMMNEHSQHSGEHHQMHNTKDQHPADHNMEKSMKSHEHMSEHPMQHRVEQSSADAPKQHSIHEMEESQTMPQAHMHGDVSHYEPVADDVRSNTAIKLKLLKTMPASGKARDGGFDGRYVMESINITDTFDQICAKGSRGLMMLDNTTWEKCGGKPQGLSAGKNAEIAVPNTHTTH